MSSYGPPRRPRAPLPVVPARMPPTLFPVRPLAPPHTAAGRALRSYSSAPRPVSPGRTGPELAGSLPLAWSRVGRPRGSAAATARTGKAGAGPVGYPLRSLAAPRRRAINMGRGRGRLRTQKGVT